MEDKLFNPDEYRLEVQINRLLAELSELVEDEGDRARITDVLTAWGRYLHQGQGG